MPMIVSTARRLAFLHIPKNAGTSIGSQLATAFPEDVVRLDCTANPAAGAFFADHPTLWQIDLLSPELLARLRDYDVIAILRDPFDRFRSALAEYIRTQTKADPHKLDPAQYVHIIDEVRTVVSGDPRWPRAFNFFRPQHEFIDYQGQRYANRLYDVRQLAPLRDYLSVQYGVRFNAAPPARQTWSYGATTRHMVNILAPGLRRALPERAYLAFKDRVKPLIAKRSNNMFHAALERRDIQDWIKTAYQEDFRLYQELTETGTSSDAGQSY